MSSKQETIDILKFRLYGNFAHFNQPISNNLRNTYSIIPKTQLLGLLGSLMGFSGYVNKRTEPEYYKALSGTQVYISPNLKTYHRFIVKYNSLNSFLNNRKQFSGVNAIINEQVIQYPDYNIGVVLQKENEVHKRMIEMVQNERSVFPIYLGKNEFPANMEYLGIDSAESNENGDVIVKSIIPLEELNRNGEDMRLEQLPVGFNEKYKFILKVMAIPPPEGSKVCVKEPEKIIMVDGYGYYVF